MPTYAEKKGLRPSPAQATASGNKTCHAPASDIAPSPSLLPPPTCFKQESASVQGCKQCHSTMNDMPLLPLLPKDCIQHSLACSCFHVCHQRLHQPTAPNLCVLKARTQTTSSN
eukprot:12316185-Alexandrium_andersonii.AAC.1